MKENGKAEKPAITIMSAHKDQESCVVRHAMAQGAGLRVVRDAVSRAARSRSSHVPNVGDQDFPIAAKGYESSLSVEVERKAARRDPRQLDMVDWIDETVRSLGEGNDAVDQPKPHDRMEADPGGNAKVS